MSVLKQYNAASGLWQAVGGMGLPQTPVSFSAHKNGVDQTDITGSWADKKVTFTSVERSNGNGYDAVNSKFIATVEGLYSVIAQVQFTAPVDQEQHNVSIYKNGSVYKKGHAAIASGTVGYPAMLCACQVFLKVNEYIEVYASHGNAGNKTIYGDPAITFFQACLVPDSYDSTNQIIDLSAATSDYLLGVGETAKITYSGVTSRSLRVKTEEGVYELSIDQPYVTTNSVEGGVSLSPNETTYANSFVFSESRTDNAVNVSDGAASWSGWHNGATSGTFAIGYVYIMTGKYRISTRTNSKSITGQCVRLGGTTAPLSMQNEVFAGIWKDTTTVWSSLGKITFPFAQSGIIYIKRIA